MEMAIFDPFEHPEGCGPWIMLPQGTIILSRPFQLKIGQHGNNRSIVAHLAPVMFHTTFHTLWKRQCPLLSLSELPRVAWTIHNPNPRHQHAAWAISAKNGPKCQQWVKLATVLICSTSWLHWYFLAFSVPYTQIIMPSIDHLWATREMWTTMPSQGTIIMHCPSQLKMGPTWKWQEYGIIAPHQCRSVSYSFPYPIKILQCQCPALALSELPEVFGP